jgi:hypothetical protein
MAFNLELVGGMAFAVVLSWRYALRAHDSILACVTWELWKEPNARYFRGAVTQVTNLLPTIKQEAEPWVRAATKNLDCLLPRVIPYYLRKLYCLSRLGQCTDVRSFARLDRLRCNKTFTLNTKTCKPYVIKEKKALFLAQL